MSVVIQHRELVNGYNTPNLDAVHLLGPMDHLFPYFITVSVLFVYKYPSSHLFGSSINDSQNIDDFMSVDLVRQSMQRLMQSYPHLTGRVRINNRDKTPEIHHLNTGASLITAKHNASLADATNNVSLSSITVRSFADAGISLELPPPRTPEEAYSNAVFAVQHTRFACGSVCLGICMPHWVTDGEGFFQIVRDLAAHFRNIRREQRGLIVEVIKPPHIHAYLADINQTMTNAEKTAALEFNPSSVTLQDPPDAVVADLNEQSKCQAIVSEGPMQSRILRFSAAEIKALKTDVLSDLRSSSFNQLSWVSSFEALAAHIHFHVYHARLAYEKRAFPHADHTNRKEDLVPPMNWRSKDRLDLPPRYALNAALNVVLHLSAIDFQGNVARIAQKVHDTYQQQTRIKVDALLRWVAAQPDKSALAPRVKFEHALFITPWNKLGMYRGFAFEEINSFTKDQTSSPVDPILVSPAFDSSTMYPRTCIFLEAPPASQSINQSTNQSNSRSTNSTAPCSFDVPVDVCLSLTEAVWSELDSNAEFRKFASH